MEEKRLAMNGKPYTEQQFEEYYGDKAKEYWNEAAARSLQSCESTFIAAEHGVVEVFGRYHSSDEEDEKESIVGHACGNSSICFYCRAWITWTNLERKWYRLVVGVIFLLRFLKKQNYTLAAEDPKQLMIREPE